MNELDLGKVGRGLLFIVIIVILTFFIFRSCNKPPDVVISELGAKEISQDETIHINNCSGKGDSEQTVEHSFGTSLGADVSAKIDAQVLESNFVAKYGQYRSTTVSHRVVAPPGTDMQIVLRWVENEYAGNVVIDGESAGPYAVRIHNRIEQVSAKDLGCPGQPTVVIPLPTTAPITISEGGNSSSWFQMVGNHFPFGYRPLALFKWMYDDSSLGNGAWGIIVFLVRLLLAGAFFFVDLFLIIFLGIGAVINLYFGALAMSIYLAVVGLIVVVWVFNH